MGESRVRPAQKGDTHAAGRLTAPKTEILTPTGENIDEYRK